MMIRQKLLSVMLLGGLWLSSPAMAQSNFAYYGLEPDIITNYLGANARQLGYVRVTVELMLEDAEHLEAAQHHSPLMRSTIIDIIGRQPEDKVKSLTGREDIRRTCLDELKRLMQKETGSPMIRDVIFTKYLYQGG